MLEHVNHRVPVTALHLLHRHEIAVAEGGHLRVYDVPSGRCLAVLKVFTDQAIHGIISHHPSGLLVWGGRSIVPIELQRSATDEIVSLTSGLVHCVQDWILDVACSNSSEHGSEDGTVAIVTAHDALALVLKSSFVARTSVLDETTAAVDINVTIPGSNCILYCAHIRWLSTSQCLVVSGTAFGDINVWSCTVTSTENATCTAEATSHYSFLAHEGSIFGVSVSSLIHDPSDGKSKRLLASCSDDRTVRIWDVANLKERKQQLSGTERGTGFGTQPEAQLDAPALLARAMGHVSRIWHVRFQSETLRDSEPSSNSLDTLKVISFGEDTSTITWNLRSSSNGNDQSFCLEQSHAESTHVGKHIWSVANSSDGSLATGGADSAVVIRGASRRNPTAVPIGQEWMMGNKDDKIRNYDFASESLLVATTDKGRILTISTAVVEGDSTAEVAAPLSGLQGYSLTASLPGHVFAAGADGHVYCYFVSTSKLDAIVKTSGKVTGLFAVQADRSGNTAALLVTTLGSKVANLFFLNTDSSQTESGFVRRACELELPPSATVKSCALLRRRGSNVCVALGLRTGGVLFYLLAPEESSKVKSLLHAIPSVHGREAVTSLLWQEDESDRETLGFLHSTGRNGVHCVHSITLTGDNLGFRTVHQSSLAFGPNIEGCAVMPQTGDVWVWGFKSTFFVVFDTSNQREIMRVECGGAHRVWTFRPERSGGTFVWTKASSLFRVTQSEAPYRLINGGFHGREIKATAVLQSTPWLIATGAEDTDIKISTFDEGDGFKHWQTLRKHNTGIQHLQWLSSSGEQRGGEILLFSSGGFEEFFVWRVTPGIPDIGVGVMCESLHPRSGNSDLRIMAFKVHTREDTGPIVSANAELVITMAYSDSTLRQWTYSQPDQWRLNHSADYLTACLTQVFSIPSAPSLLATTATDGHLTLWPPRSREQDARLTWNQRIPIHQNTILSSCQLPLSDTSTLIITGGDDNALAATRIPASDAPRTTRPTPPPNPPKNHPATATTHAPHHASHTLIIPRAHAAAVTGVAVISKQQQKRQRSLHPPSDTHASSSDEAWLVSASIDQRVKLWRVRMDVDRPGIEGLRVDKMQSRFTAVADVSGLETWPMDDDGTVGVLICGVGMDVWKMRVEDGKTGA